MLRLRTLELLKKKGKTCYWLHKQLGMSYSTTKNMIENKTTSIKYSSIETMCDVLNCTPADLFEYDPEK